MPLEPPASPVLVGNRYAITGEPMRVGGMSTVHQAFDIQRSRLCAIKRMKNANGDDLRWKASFNREYGALSELTGHPNIVTLYEANTDADGYYMVLEWVPDNLLDWIGSKGKLSWTEFYRSIGRPLLEAIVFAQSRGWNHRDIKPQNILIADGGTPKLSDYGIAKHASPEFGLTFSSFRSVPFTPPEDDSGDRMYSRDCFSWAAVAVFCLTGQVLLPDYGDLSRKVAELDRSEIPVDLLEEALSATPSERPALASVMLADLDEWSKSFDQTKGEKQILHLMLDKPLAEILLRTLDVPDRSSIEQQLLEELREVAVGIEVISANTQGPKGLRLYSVTWILEGYPSPPDNARFLITKAWRSGSSEVERLRETAFRPSLDFSFSIPLNAAISAEAIKEIAMATEAFQAEQRAKSLLLERERVFRLWYAFLRAKADLEARRENAILYVDFELRGQQLTLTTELPAPEDLIGQPRVVKLTSGGHILCEIIGVSLNEIVVTITSGDPTKLPRKGRLEVNTIAAEKSIERQRRALDAINYDRAANPKLKGLILDPSSSQRPHQADIPKSIDGAPFDEEKTEILRRALGLEDVLAIQGPPGTGKTRLIEEILVKYFSENPNRRVLLSAQTHVALDNVIERLMVRQPEMAIVRIGRLDDVKISSASRNLLLDRKAETWAEGVKLKAEAYMREWASSRGLDKDAISTGMLAERLILLMRREKVVRESLRAADNRSREVEKQTDAKLATTGSAESSTLEVASIETQQAASELRIALSRIRAEANELRANLAKASGYGAELASQTEESELRDWAKLLVGEGDDQRICAGLLQLQEDWVLRVGRSSDFHAAMLASAQVVAGTCIGMAGVRGMGEVVYDLCIVDEASKATATEIFIPLSRARRWILVGDPKQLPPFFEDYSVTRLDEFDEDEVRSTILDRFHRGLPEYSKALLRNQYRMVRPIGDLISRIFYEGMLQSPKTKADVTLPGVFPKAVTWLSTSEFTEFEEITQGRSFRNEAECRVVKESLAQIDFVARKRKSTYTVALIAGYVAQVKALQDIIRDQVLEWTGLEITCSTVDAFQGSEADICIYSVTRSNLRKQLGFLKEKPRLNVALSRGKSALIIVGDDRFCRAASGENPFKAVISHIETNADGCEIRVAK